MRILPQTKKNKNKVSNQSGNKQRNHHSNKNTNSRHNQKNEKTAPPPHASSSSSSFSSSQPLNTDVPPETSVLKTRRIIKATTPSTPPPPSASSSQEILDHSFPEEELVGTMEDSRGVSERSFVGIKAPAVQQEELQEKVQQWRKERIETSAAIRKEHKEKEIKEHRLRKNVTTSTGSESLIKSGTSGGTSSMDDDHDVVVAATREESNEKDSHPPKDDELPSILSVLPKFPEHKRKKPSHIDQDNLKKLKTAEELLQEGGDRLNVLVPEQKEEEEDGTNKTKKKGEEQKHTTEDDDDAAAAEGDVAGDATTESWSYKAKQVLQSSSAPVVGAIVAALAIMVTSRWMRKK